MRNLLSTRRRKAAAILGVVALIGAGTALAAWITSGTGESVGRAGAILTLTVERSSLSPSPSGPDALYPGGTGAAQVKVTNPNAPLVITAVSGDGTGTSSSAACPHTNVSVETLSGLSIPLPAGVSDNLRIPGALKMRADAVNECQNVSFYKTMTVTASTPTP